jgi:hypothetical protein
MKIKPLRDYLKDYLKSHNLIKKFEKARKLFESNIKHPSLNTELKFKLGLMNRPCSPKQ